MLLLWLDDERKPPSKDWIWVRTAPEAIKALRTARFEVISLDHDLGEDAGTGYDVLKYLEAEVFQNPDYGAPEIRLHTANSAARMRMIQAVDSIERQLAKSQQDLEPKY